MDDEDHVRSVAPEDPVHLLASTDVRVHVAVAVAELGFDARPVPRGRCLGAEELGAQVVVHPDDIQPEP